MTPTFDHKPKITCKPGTFGHLLKVSTINEAAVNAFPRWLVMTCYGLILFGIYLTILKGIIWIAIVFAAVALFLLIQYGMKPAQQLIRFLESHDDAWMRYSGIPLQSLDPKLLNQSIEKLDRQREKFHRALAAKTGEDFRQLVGEVDWENEVDTPPLNALEAMQQHLASWDSSLFFAGSSRSGKTTASQHYAAVLKPYYFSLKPDFMPPEVKGVQGSLEQSEQLYLWLLPFYQEFKYRVKHRLTEEAPLWLFIDELETQLSNLERADKQRDKEAIKLLPEVVGMVNSILKLGNAHKVRFGLITQSVLSKNTKLDTDAMAALSWLLCGSELGGFGAFKSDRIKSRCSEATLGQVKLMIDHPDGVRGFWWLMELKGNFRLLEAPAPIAEAQLQQIGHFDPNRHPFQGRQLAPGEEVDWNQSTSSRATTPIAQPSRNGQKGKGKAALMKSAKVGLTKLRDRIRHAVGADEYVMNTVDTSAQPVPKTPLEEELDKVRVAIAGNAHLEQQLEACLPTLEQIYRDDRLDLLRIVRLSMERGLISIRQIQKLGSSEMRRMNTGEIHALLQTLEGHYYLGVIYPEDKESNIAYLAFDEDERTASS